MMTKINVIPVLKGHLATLKNRDRTRYLYGDLIGFYGIPLVAAIIAFILDIHIRARYVDVGIIAHTIFIPLLVNVLFLIYSIKDRGKTDEHPKRKRLLDELYQNVAYTVLISILSLVSLSIQVISSLPCWLRSVNQALIFMFLIHLLLLILMIVKRTYILLQTELDDAED